MPDAVIIIDRKGTFLDISDEAENVSGYSRKELLGRNLFATSILNTKTKAFVIRKLAMHFSGGKITPFEVDILRKDGKTVRLEIKPQIIDYFGKTADLVALRDLTERKRAEEALKESEERYRIQFEESLDAIFIADAKTGILVDCNRAAARLVGREKSEIVGKHQSILHPPEDNEGQFSKTFRKHAGDSEGQTLETHVITKEGELRDVAIKANIIELGGKKLIQGLFRDITERKIADKALKDSEKRLQDVVMSSADIVWEVDKSGKYTFISGNIERILVTSRRKSSERRHLT